MSSPVAHSAVYRWVDKDGTTHYSETQSANGHAEQIFQSSAPTPDPQMETQLKELLKSQEQSQQLRDNKAKEQESRAREESARTEACRRASERFTGLASHPRVSVKEPDGTLRRITEEERRAHLAEEQKRIKEYCGQ
ncbi:MAG: DUF4124 domain-containing protein [Gammaproteobacteria bacterium]|nr:DUF4124 domain-containing protein [Gammaproteobacteria bacterium]